MNTTIDEQPTLFDEVRLIHRRPSAEEAFAAFRRSHPTFMRRFAQLALDDRTIGRRGSAKRYFELLRDEYDVRLNNDWTALAARLAMEDYEGLKGYFELRERKS